MCGRVCGAAPRRAAPRRGLSMLCVHECMLLRVSRARGPCVMRACVRVRVQVLKEFLKGADDAAIAKLPKAEQVPRA